MTPVILLDRLKEFVEKATKDLLLPTKGTAKTPGGIRAPEVWKMALPDRNSKVQKIPYIILQLVNGIDRQDEGEGPSSQCNVRIIVGAYSENDSEGAMHVLNVMDRIRERLLKTREVGNQFILEMPLEYLSIPDSDTAPYFFGEMMTVWRLPAVKREVPETWQQDKSMLNQT